MKKRVNSQTAKRMIECAIEVKKQIAIHYIDQKGDESVRVVEPIKWLLPNRDRTSDTEGFLAWCTERDCYRHFKLSSINRLLITDYDYQWEPHRRAV